MSKQHLNPNIKSNTNSRVLYGWDSKINIHDYNLSEYDIIDMSYEPINRDDRELMNALSSFDGIVLSSDASLRTMPFVYSDTLLKEYVRDVKETTYINTNKSCLFVAFMLNPRFHRVELYKCLEMNGLLNGNHVSFNQLGLPVTDEWISDSDKNKFKDIKIEIDVIDVLPTYSHKGKFADPDVSDAYYEIVTETLFYKSGLFITEKSYRFALTGTVPIIIGQPGTVKFLRNQGFDMFDDLIDHSYDEVTNHTRRLDMVLSQIPNLVPYDAVSMKDRLEHNRELLLAIAEDFGVHMYDVN